MFGNLPPPVIPVRKEISPVSHADSTRVTEQKALLESTGTYQNPEMPSTSARSGDVPAPIESSNSLPFSTCTASLTAISVDNSLPETASVSRVPSATANITPNLSSTVSKNLPDAGVVAAAVTAPMSNVTQTEPASCPIQEDNSKDFAPGPTRKLLNHGMEPPVLRSSSSSESVESRNSR